MYTNFRNSQRSCNHALGSSMDAGMCGFNLVLELELMPTKEVYSVNLESHRNIGQFCSARKPSQVRTI
jgi:hypothetical protein